jgi:hypothetical protein
MIGAFRGTPRLLAGAVVLLTASLLGCSSGGPNPQATSSPEPQTLPTAPAAPWKTVWSDSFNGPAGSGVSIASWKYDNGQGAIFGTGEVEQTTSLPANVHLDGNGNLDIVALQNGSSWTSGRIQTTKAQFVAPAGGEMIISASIRQPDPANAGGVFERMVLDLGCVSGTLSEIATVWRRARPCRPDLPLGLPLQLQAATHQLARIVDDLSWAGAGAAHPAGR